MSFTVAAVLFGDYPDLAERLLGSFDMAAPVDDVRIGLNQVGDRTVSLVTQWARRFSQVKPVVLYWPDRNIGKYPLMRQMLFDEKARLADWLMWFDDDSHLEVQPCWWDELQRQLVGCTQLGALHLIRQRGLQYQEIPKQPWYTGKPVNANTQYRFATGGWWVADTAFLRRWEYPFKALHHNGGDSILGELLRQQDATLKGWGDGVHCCCESCVIKTLRPSTFGRVRVNVGGRKGRRGIGVTGEQYVWASGPADLSHQNFQLRIQRYV